MQPPSVLLKDQLSEAINVENGIPQGGILKEEPRPAGTAPLRVAALLPAAQGFLCRGLLVGSVCLGPHKYIGEKLCKNVSK